MGASVHAGPLVPYPPLLSHRYSCWSPLRALRAEPKPIPLASPAVRGGGEAPEPPLYIVVVVPDALPVELALCPAVLFQIDAAGSGL
jgi:hypothetical protein